MSDTLNHVHITHESAASEELTPPHSPRVETEGYRQSHDYLINKMDKPCACCGVRKSTLHDPTCNPYAATALETHHFPIERSLTNSVCPDKVHKRFSEVIDHASLEKFVDSPRNLLVLCLTGDSPVLMASGEEKPINEIAIGEMVIGHDMRPHRVRGTMHRDVDEELMIVNGVKMTANHPILTQRGWVPAGSIKLGELVYSIEVVSSQMVGVTLAEFEVLNPVVCLDTINVMHPLSRQESTPDMLFHDPSVLKVPSEFSINPSSAAYVSSRGDMPTKQSLRPCTRQRIQHDHTAVIRTEALAIAGSGCLDDEGVTALFTDNGNIPPLEGMLTNRATGIATRDITRSTPSRGAKLSITNNTAFNDKCRDAPVFLRRWNTINQLERVSFHGVVYDISISHSRSFVTRGLVVHNCDVCHRSPERGIHHLLPQDWFILPFLRNDYIIATTSADAQRAEAIDEKIMEENNA